MKHHFTIASILLAASLLLTGCKGEETTDDVARPADTRESTSANAVDTNLPDDLFTDAAAGDAVALAEAKSGVAVGDEVTFEARVGGRKDVFVDGRAMFFVTDSSLLSCDQMHGDTCPTPWDYCCEAKDNLLAHMATVQVVGEDGRPLKHSLESKHGLSPLKTVVVTGTVSQIDESGTMVVDAETIHVKEG